MSPWSEWVLSTWEIKLTKYYLNPCIPSQKLPVAVNVPSFERRELASGLATNETCRLFGWGGSSLNPRADQVRIYNSTFCNNNETQAFCTNFANGGAEQCRATLGSPIFCTNSAITQHGFLISDTRQIGGFCKEIGGLFTIQYHSIETFQDWIMQVSAGGKLTAPLAMIFGIIGYFLYFNFMWWFTQWYHRYRNKSYEIWELNDNNALILSYLECVVFDTEKIQ